MPARVWIHTIITLSLLYLASGCSGSADAPATAAAKSPAGGNSRLAKLTQEPTGCVTTFLEAVRTGDEQTAAELLTPLARQKTEERGMQVAPEGSDSASFEVGEAELIAEDLAHVATRWSDVDEMGESFTDDIIWCLRRRPDGWRVAGMATKVFEDQPPLLLDFEDPEDMERKQELVEEEIRRRAGLAQPNSQPPATAQTPEAAGNQIQR